MSAHLENELIEMVGRLDSLERELKRRPVVFGGDDGNMEEAIERIEKQMETVTNELKRMSGLMKGVLNTVDEITTAYPTQPN